MTLFLTPDPDEDPILYNMRVKYMAATWADLILLGLNNGEKPEILVDRSGSMTSRALKTSGKHRTNPSFDLTRMDVSRTLISMVASILSKRNKGFDLTQIPVKSWGSNVYDKHMIVTGLGSNRAFKEIVTTLDDFLPANFTNNNPPIIECTDGTNHNLWFNESDFPLVITDDYYQAGIPAFVANMKRFDWCNGANIIVIDNASHEPRLRKIDREVMDNAAVDRIRSPIVPSDYTQEDLDEYYNSRGPAGAYSRLQMVMDQIVDEQ
jgi:hypothetical protein